MTTLDSYLAAVYDAAAEAETLALINGQRRLRRMIEAGRLPEDASVPVYHASDLSVTLDVGLEARETEQGTELVVTEPGPDDDTAIDVDLEVYDMLEAGDLPDPQSTPGGPDAVDVHFPVPGSSAAADEVSETRESESEESESEESESRESESRESESRQSESEEPEDDRDPEPSSRDADDESEEERERRDEDERERRRRNEDERDEQRTRENEESAASDDGSAGGESDRRGEIGDGPSPVRRSAEGGRFFDLDLDTLMDPFGSSATDTGPDRTDEEESDRDRDDATTDER
ncbi:hypothetical protein [Halorubrum aethiopicum]|uniref:hypothetical protein n=1 Tax=Halorubrum aethiopicum TaxID=1758255 RepID=UPI000835D136|nr:hypothetical protein [Halorubrum aethiopicum]